MSGKYDRMRDTCDMVVLAKLVRATGPLNGSRLSEISGYSYIYVAVSLERLEHWGIIRTLDGGYVCADRRAAMAWLYAHRPDLLPSPGII